MDGLLHACEMGCAACTIACLRCAAAACAGPQNRPALPPGHVGGRPPPLLAQPWLAFVDRNSSVSVWNYESDEASWVLPPLLLLLLPLLRGLARLPQARAGLRWLQNERMPRATLPQMIPNFPQLLYDAQLGGADEAALQEAALRQRADRGAAAAGLSAT